MLFATKPLAVVDLPADAKHMSRGRKSVPRLIVLHATAGSDSRAWLTHTSNPPVSCNRLIARDGTNYKIVDDKDTAWAQGYGVMGPYVPRGTLTCNDIGLSIELENLNNGKQGYPEAQLNMCAAQIVEWFGLYGFLPLVAHWQIDIRKSDPLAFPWASLQDRIWALITQLRDI